MESEKLNLIRQRLESAEKSISSAKKMLARLASGAMLDDSLTAEEKAEGLAMDEDARVVEGVFDGESMIGPDKRKYPVPANYASKSKLVDGDILKLTINQDGSFIYKQIGPVDRKRVVGILEKEPSGSFHVQSESVKYKILLASVTYFQAQEGDEITLVVPKDGKSIWGAVENVLRNGAVPTEKEKEIQHKEQAIKELEESTAPEDDFDQLEELDELSDM